MALCLGGCDCVSYSNSTSYVKLPLETIRNTFRFSGRSQRTEMIVYFLFSILLNGVTAILLFPSISRRTALLAIGLLGIAYYVPMIALYVRRLHDFNFSGWWLVVLLAASVSSVLIGAGLFGLNLPDQIATVLRVVAGLGWWAAFLIPGTKGENRFGENPR